MANISEDNRSVHEQDDNQPYKVRLPGFIADQEVCLGDVIKHTTAYFGIKPCGGWEQRAAALNNWLIFTRR